MKRTRGGAPGPNGQLVLGNLMAFRRDPLAFYTACARGYGDIVKFRLANTTVYLISHPHDIESVLVTNHNAYSKGRVLQAARGLLGNGLLTSEGDLWLRQRRMLQPAFHRNNLDGYAPTMVSQTKRTLHDWDTQPNNVIDIFAEMQRLTLRITAGALFGSELQAEEEEISISIAALWTLLAKRITSGLLFPQAIPTPTNLKMRRALHQLDHIIHRVVSARPIPQSHDDNLLAVLLHHAEQGAMTYQQVRDEVITLLVAGHATTATMLGWTWYLLIQNPHVTEKLLNELECILDGREPVTTDVPKLKYMEALLTESLRLYPPSWTIPRIAMNDCVINGYRIPAGSSVSMSQWVVHHDPRFYEQPDEFRPERWLSGLASRLPRYAYFPFGGGPRQCIGSGFAMLEATLIIAMIIRRYHFTLCDPHSVVPVPSMTLYPRDGIKVIATRRTS